MLRPFEGLIVQTLCRAIRIGDLLEILGQQRGIPGVGVSDSDCDRHQAWLHSPLGGAGAGPLGRTNQRLETCVTRAPGQVI